MSVLLGVLDEPDLVDRGLCEHLVGQYVLALIEHGVHVGRLEQVLLSEHRPLVQGVAPLPRGMRGHQTRQLFLAELAGLRRGSNVIPRGTVGAGGPSTVGVRGELVDASCDRGGGYSSIFVHF